MPLRPPASLEFLIKALDKPCIIFHHYSLYTQKAIFMLFLVIFEQVLQRKGLLGRDELPRADSGEGRMMGGIKREQGGNVSHATSAEK